jgi:hypothetical protein
LTLFPHGRSFRLDFVHAHGPNIFSIQTPQGRFNVLSFTSPADVVARGIPEKAIIGTLPSNVVDISQATLKQNASFVLFLHKVIATHGPIAPSLMNEALQIGRGSLFLIDARATTPGGQQESEDVFGMFQVEGGQIVKDSYQPNPDYLLVSKRGLFVLDTWFHARLLEELAKL